MDFAAVIGLAALVGLVIWGWVELRTATMVDDNLFIIPPELDSQRDCASLNSKNGMHWWRRRKYGYDCRLCGRYHADLDDREVMRLG